MYKINIFDKISCILVLIGALNWGFIGLLNKNIVYILVGGSVFLQRVIYILVFLAAIDLIYVFFKCKVIKISL